MPFKVGDLVTRKSYGGDVLFRITAIDWAENVAQLVGVDMRLLADAPLDDLVHVDEDLRGRVSRREEELLASSVQQLRKNREPGPPYFKLPGRVLHLDGDASYLKKCLAFYEALEIPVYGIHLAERQMPEEVYGLLTAIQPDILVITGHDAYLRSVGDKQDVAAYRHSQYFYQAVQRARQYERNKDNLIIFAGACQSHFEALIEAGANFASAPERVNIHCLDPLFIVEQAAYTPIDQIVNLQQAIQHSRTGSAGLGGIDTKGTFRLGIPRLKVV